MSQWKWIEKTQEEIIAINNNIFEKIILQKKEKKQ